MKRSEFIKKTGLGIGGFVLGVGLNLGMLLNKDAYDWQKANPIIAGVDMATSDGDNSVVVMIKQRNGSVKYLVDKNYYDDFQQIKEWEKQMFEHRFKT